MRPATSLRATILSITIAMLVPTGLAAEVLELHVSPQGDDTGSGSSDAPLATLEGARNGLRKARAAGKTSAPAHIIVADGRYELAGPLVLLPDDGGTVSAQVTYEAAPGARPVFSGGRKITGFQPHKNGIWRAFVPDVAAGKWYFEQLFVNEKRAVRARTPNALWFRPVDVGEELDPSEESKSPRKGRQTLWMRPDDFPAVSDLVDGELKDVNLVVCHNWDNTRRFLDHINPEDRSLVTSGEAMKPWNPWRKNSTFILENFPGALDEPGEWFLSRDGCLYYMPLPGEEMNTAEVYAPVAEKLLVLQGDAAAGRLVDHVTFKGLVFQHGQWLTPQTGFEPNQAAASIEAVVMADGACNIAFEDCEIAHVGTYGIWFRKGCRDNTVRRCRLFDLGAGGIKIGETKPAANAAESTGHITVDNNIIRAGGFIFPCAVGVWIGFSPDNRITHNEIADLFYTGISIGWRWGYGESNAKRNRISDNHIHHIGKGLMSDMGGIYTLGPSEGTVVSGNLIHDIQSYSYGGWGLYADEGSSGILFENNIVYDTKTGGFHQHYGRENVVRNNIFVDSTQHQIQASRVEPHLSFTFEQNIISWATGPALSGPWKELKFAGGNNCWWNHAGETIKFAEKPLPEWQKQGHEEGSIIADPLFVDASCHDFRLLPGSPALDLGIQPVDCSKAGLYGDTSWTAGAQTYPRLQAPPEPPADPIHETFERDKAGEPPRHIDIHVENNGDSILVTDETAAAGRHSLKITDAPGLKQTYNPHLTWTVNFPDGIATNGFDLLVEPGSVIEFEWRDWSAHQYQTGVQFSIRNCKLTTTNGEAMDLPSGQWMHFEITGGIGGQSPRTWSLAVTAPGQEARQFKGLPYEKPDFKRLTWIGFTSNASENTSFNLDNFKFQSKQPRLNQPRHGTADGG